MKNNNRNILFYFNWQLKPTHHGIVISKLQDILQDSNARVRFLSCDNQLSPCYSNPKGDSVLCGICKFNKNAALSPFKDSVRQVTILRNENILDRIPAYEDVNSLKSLQYKGVKIGLGAFSSYLSLTRNLEPVIDETFRQYFDGLLSGQIILTDTLEELQAEENIDEIYFFNGRTADTRPLYDFAVKHKIPFVSLELIKKSESEFFVNEFENCLPHDIDFHHQRMIKLWSNPDKSLEEKTNIGSGFFQKRREGVLVRDRKVYTSNQKQGLLPAQWDDSRKNIVVFQSSEDEFASLGDIFDKFALFDTQEKGILFLANQLKQDAGKHLYIRIHPNLKEVNYDYHHRLYELEKQFPLVTVIPPDSDISTYTLMDHADVVVAFGSSTGAEACFWDKPVILLAGSFYYHLDIAYKPKSKEELLALLKEENLRLKNRIEAVKYGYYLVNYYEYANLNPLSPIAWNLGGGRVVYLNKFLKLLQSRKLFKLVDAAARKINETFQLNRFEIPK